jgi:hypothetical protein
MWHACAYLDCVKPPNGKNCPLARIYDLQGHLPTPKPSNTGRGYRTFEICSRQGVSRRKNVMLLFGDKPTGRVACACNITLKPFRNEVTFPGTKACGCHRFPPRLKRYICLRVYWGRLIRFTSHIRKSLCLVEVPQDPRVYLQVRGITPERPKPRNLSGGIRISRESPSLPLIYIITLVQYVVLPRRLPLFSFQPPSSK